MSTPENMIYGYSMGNFVLSKQGIKDENDDLILPNSKGMIIDDIVNKRKGRFTIQWENGKKGKEYREKNGSNVYDIHIPVADKTDINDENK